ncbi:MAG: amidase [Burkholderiales bacterium]
MAKTPDELCRKPIAEVSRLLRERQISCEDLTSAVLDRIAALDGTLHSYITVCSDAAVEQARAADREIAAGKYRGPLHGIPVGVKDIIFTKGIRTTCGSKIFADFVPDYDATVVSRLRTAGAVVVGKHSMTEFAGIAYHPSITPPVNPWNRARWPGASSGGSAVAVAAGLCFAAIGTDTGGSVRFPAASCGVVGLKPTCGAVSRYGVFPLAQSLDHVGPIARTVEDACIVLRGIAGFDAQDPTTRSGGSPECNFSSDNLRSLRISVDQGFCSDGISEEVSSGLSQAAAQLQELGATIIGGSVRGLEEATAIWGTIYCGDSAAAHESTYAQHADDYNPIFRAGLEAAFKMNGVAYARANAKRAEVTRAINNLLQDTDVLLWPAMGQTARVFEELAPGGVIAPETADYLLRYTAPMSVSGHPALVLCCGFDNDGLPIAMQLIARHGREDLLFRVGTAYQQATDWHKRFPAV